MEFDSRADTLFHIRRVGELVTQVVHELIDRPAKHDASKLEDPELDMFNMYTPKLATTTYGSEEYKAHLINMGEALQHHYANNRHHPEWSERDEEWRAVVGYEGFYEVSNLGDVRSVTRKVQRSGTQGDLVRQGQTLTAHLTPKGYCRLQLVRDGKHSNHLVHRLVADTFIPLPNVEKDVEVNHKDGDKTNNHASNLEWVTSSENLLHAYATGLKAVKYVVHCPELDITTFGTQRMEKACHERGYTQVSAPGIWGAMDRNRKHAGLTFEGTLLAEWQRSRLDGMTLVDLIEMMADWKAASERHADGDLSRSLPINAERFGIGPQLLSVLTNTVRELGWL